MAEAAYISIVTPSYNQGAFLEATISSVLHQAETAVEHMVLDGGSTDGSAEIIARYSSCLAFSRCASDGGQAAAIDEGFRRSTGQVLGWLNSDDILLPGALAAVERYFCSHQEVDVAVGGCVFVDKRGDAVHDRLGLPLCNLGAPLSFHRLLYVGMVSICQPAVFFRREAYFRAGGLDMSMRFSFDYDLLLRMLRRGRAGRIRRYLAAFRVHPEAKTQVLAPVNYEEDRQVRAKWGYDVQCPSRRQILARLAYRQEQSARVRAFRLAQFVGVVARPAV